MRAVAACVAVLAFALAACGDGDDGDPGAPQPTVTVTVTETVTPSPPASSPSPSPTSSPTAPTAGVDPCEAIEPFGDGIAFIVVSSPAPGELLEPGDTVEGCGNTFEAAYQWELLDSQGNQLAGDAGTMTCGNGCFGEFSFTADFTPVDSQQIGTLRVFETSAQDGSDVHVNAIPVLLQP